MPHGPEGLVLGAAYPTRLTWKGQGCRQHTAKCCSVSGFILLRLRHTMFGLSDSCGHSCSTWQQFTFAQQSPRLFWARYLGCCLDCRCPSDPPTCTQCLADFECLLHEEKTQAKQIIHESDGHGARSTPGPPHYPLTSSTRRAEQAIMNNMKVSQRGKPKPFMMVLV
jgi:hypothetical protein